MVEMEKIDQASIISKIIAFWLSTWVTPIGEMLPSVTAELNGKTDNSSNKTQLVVEIQVLRSTQYWLHHDKRSNAITDFAQQEEPLVLKLYPVDFHDVRSCNKDVFRNGDLISLISCICDYTGDTVPSNFAPQDFAEDFEEELVKICNTIPEQVDIGNYNGFLFVTIPIRVVRIVQVFHADGEEDNCLQCRWSRGNFDDEFVREKINSLPPTSYSTLFDAVIMKFNGVDGEEHNGECSICLKEFEKGISVTELPCSHVFHTECTVNWFAEVTNCPICRSYVNPPQSETDHGLSLLAGQSDSL